MKTDIWMPWYPSDYERDTKQLSLEEDCIYRRALDFLWQNPSGLPRVSDRLSRCLRITEEELKRNKWVLDHYLVVVGDFYQNKRVNKEIANALNRKEVARANGKNGGNPNFQKGKSNPYYNQKYNPEDNQTHNQKITDEINSSPSPSPSPSKSSSEKKNTSRASASEGFEKFWKSYPKKVSMGQARRTWNKISPQEELQEKILSALQRAKISDQWQKDNGRFIPHASTWLNAEGWEDQGIDFKAMTSSPQAPPKAKILDEKPLTDEQHAFNARMAREQLERLKRNERNDGVVKNYNALVGELTGKMSL